MGPAPADRYGTTCGNDGNAERQGKRLIAASFRDHLPSKPLYFSPIVSSLLAYVALKKVSPLGGAFEVSVVRVHQV
jgi:hypothetical protein